MNYLFFSICFSVAASVLLKIARHHQLSLSQIVFANYPIAALLTYFIIHPQLGQPETYLSHWWLFLSLGILLPSIFITLGKAIQYNGIVRTDAAQRLSLLISSIAAFYLFHDQPTTAKLIGIGLAFLALFCLLFKKGEFQIQSGGSLWLFAVWLGYGIIDILLKILSKQGIATYSALFIIFTIATGLMLIYLLAQKSNFHFSSLLIGGLLGILNFGNIYTYIRAHQALAQQTATIFTLMNIGVIVLATLIGLTFFREKISRINLAGLLIAIVAIFILYQGHF
ncbi:DMT family transporter [Suttonella ornithocola]|uniref:EamA-like transporter family n=1 Tax=Suttonella ornithocola TaxID=279832 RepID=A0A380MR88_9GAMM|nr:DMT family transporter [Suttonella ornithocola]SUO95095.1 EamA-like transporter family [Suttonella ornithocola]